jgi:hypothetical protein
MQQIKGIAVFRDRLVAVGRDTVFGSADAAVWIGRPRS